jgi:phosphoribosylanthranilate isomerase
VLCFADNWQLATAFMTWVKICGITNLDDALVAVDAGADAVGFVFYEKSPRNVDVETAREIVAKLPEQVEKVGVFVDQAVHEVRATVLDAGFTAVQLHGNVAERAWQDSRPAAECLGVAKVIPVVAGGSVENGGALINQRAHENIFAVLIDSQSNGRAGGTGTKFDWQAAQGMVQSLGLMVPVIVAGGLTSSNVSEALELFQPFGVDVASGVEAKPGKKDPAKVRAFVQAVRAAEKRA